MTESKFTCRWALLGLSNIAKTFLDDLTLPQEGAIQHSLSCVSTTSSKEKAQQWLAERSNLDASRVQIYTTFEEMLQRGEFDIVYISTPHPLHYAHAKAAIKHGRHVLVEKPATMNKAQFESLSALAKSAGVVLMEAMWTRYLPAVQYLQQILPQIGKVKRVFSDLSVPIADEDMPRSSRLLDKQAGAGAMLDMGVYALTWVDLAFNGSPSTKVAFAKTITYDTGKELIDDINTVVLNSGDGSQVAIVTTSMTLPGSTKHSDKLAVEKVAPSVRIEAENAQVSIPFPLIRPQELHIEWYKKEKLSKDGSEVRETVSKPVERGWGLWYQADVIAREVQIRGASRTQGTGLVIGGDETVRILEWMDTARGLSGIVYDDALEASSEKMSSHVYAVLAFD
ncbi:unnamed protein product [Clonostachys rosea]|uniref:D-xylose 1-dehydrogenase (NADP(+), D-xylono-1,5-lactone-forming) n=1 Tax=Bionectria ochroleuca TaxID=29856 RepID=A0ABY6V3Y0_BIOOC|nr:unnamed protein product [Clonostachys rosea]